MTMRGDLTFRIWFMTITKLIWNSNLHLAKSLIFLQFFTYNSSAVSLSRPIFSDNWNAKTRWLSLKSILIVFIRIIIVCYFLFTILYLWEALFILILICRMTIKKIVFNFIKNLIYEVISKHQFPSIFSIVNFSF